MFLLVDFICQYNMCKNETNLMLSHVKKAQASLWKKGTKAVSTIHIWETQFEYNSGEMHCLSTTSFGTTKLHEGSKTEK